MLTGDTHDEKEDERMENFQEDIFVLLKGKRNRSRLLLTHFGIRGPTFDKTNLAHFTGYFDVIL